MLRLFLSPGDPIDPFELDQTVQVATKMSTLRKGLTSLILDTGFTLSDIEEARECTVYVSVDEIPRLDMEDWIAL